MYTTDAYTPSDGNTPKGWVQMKNPARTISSGVFSDSNSKPKAVHFDITKKSIIFVLIELYSIAILGELLYGSMGPDRYETYHFIPTFY